MGSRTSRWRAVALATIAACVVGAPSVVAASGGPSDGLDLGGEFATPQGGAAALAAMGGRVDDVARVNGLTSSQLRSTLSDAAMRVDRNGRLLAIDPAPRPRPGGERTTPEKGPYPYDQTFSLHSKAGSSKVIYLDFDGEVISGTAWNTSYGVSTAYQPGFSLDSDPGFSTAEMDVIQGVFQRVAEDYAAFDVDVTTQDPGLAAIDRSSSSDNNYGTRALVTASTELSGNICSNSCGGVAYIGVYDYYSSHQYYQPALVFPHMLSNNEKYIAEAVSHEVGHNLELRHDGTSTVGYYQGHAMWAPIMGVGYYRPVVQWSRGDYTDANNAEDDLALIQANGLSYRTDDHGDSPAAATTLTGTSSVTATGVVATRYDRDVFKVTTNCSSTLSASASPAPRSPNLDIQLRVLDAAGNQLAAADPAAAMVNYDVASGLNASTSVGTAPGTYYVEIDGIGYGSATTGYTDYASLGQYSVTISGCLGNPPTGATFTKITAGQSHTCAVTPAGGVQCWGDNSFGQLGNGSTTDSTRPVNVVGLSSGVKAVWAGANHTCANQNGAMKCWGSNSSGQLGDKTTVNRTTPVQVAGFASGTFAITAGDAFSCAITGAKVTKCWGLTFGPAPVKITGAAGAIQITAGAAHACVVLGNRSAKCWGNNSSGQLGDGTKTYRTAAVQVKTLTSGVASIWAGKFHTCAHASSGWAKCWGAGANGQLGNGTLANKLTPVTVSGMSTGVVGLRGGLSFTCAVKSGRDVWCWGRNTQGQLGNGTTTQSAVPALVSGFTGGTGGMLAAGTAHACVLNQVTSQAYCWGANDQGQLGDGTLTQRLTPTLVAP